MSKRMAVAEARASFSDVVSSVKDGGGAVKLTRYNRTVGGLVSGRDLRLLEECREALEDCDKKKRAIAAIPSGPLKARHRRK